jgi:hypothetical protein
VEGSCDHRNEPSGFEEGLSCMELFCQVASLYEITFGTDEAL